MLDAEIHALVVGVGLGLDLERDVVVLLVLIGSVQDHLPRHFAGVIGVLEVGGEDLRRHGAERPLVLVQPPAAKALGDGQEEHQVAEDAGERAHAAFPCSHAPQPPPPSKAAPPTPKS